MNLQSGKQYQKICKIMMELLTLVYLVGTILGMLGGDNLTRKVLGNQAIEAGLFTTKVLEKQMENVEENIQEIQDSMMKKIKSKINIYNTEKDWKDKKLEAEQRSLAEENQSITVEHKSVAEEKEGASDGNKSIIDEIKIPKVEIYLSGG